MDLKQSKPCWIREIEIKLYSNIFKKKLIFGGDKVNQLNIDVSGVKKLASSEDNGVVTISNLTYEDIITIIQGEYYNIEIWAGYKTSGLNCFFSGSVAFISNKPSERRDNTCYIIFASKFVSQFTQKRINLSLNSGINLYSAIKEICDISNIKNYSISPSLKNYFINESIQSFNTPVKLIDMLNNSVGDWDINSDSSSFGKIIDISNPSDKRQIKINPDTINFSQGNPTLDASGLKITLLPTFNYMPGDIIIVDNSFIDISESNLSGAQTNFKGNYLDNNVSSFTKEGTNKTDGCYIIKQIEFQFQNRGDVFQLNILAQSIGLIENLFS